MQLPCHFGKYDLDGNGEISAEEFLSVTAGFTKMDPKTLFGHLDTNGEYVNDTDAVRRVYETYIHRNNKMFSLFASLCVYLCVFCIVKSNFII